MPNPFENNSSLFPGIVGDVQKAYKENAANGDAIDIDETIPDIDDISQQDADATEAFEAPKDAFEDIDSDAATNNFEKTFEEAGKLFALIGITPPTPEEFAVGGVDFAKLAESFEEKKEWGLKPTLVICPILPITDLPGRDWKTLFKVLSSAKSAEKGGPFGAETDYGGLKIEPRIEKESDDLCKQEFKRANDEKSVHGTISEKDSKDDSGAVNSSAILWTVAVLPGTDKADGLGAAHNDYEGAGRGPSGLCTISQYLALQATKINSGQPPVDSKDTSTHLSGIIEESFNRWTPVAYWTEENLIYIYTLDHNYRTDNLGKRTPAWG